MTDVAVDGRRRTHTAIVAIVAIVAVVLGLLAFAADFAGGIVGQVVVGLTSSGFAWGLTAFLVSRSAAGARRAAVPATGLLALATLVYYLLVLLVSRWSGGYLEDGTSADLQGLRSIAIMTAFWLIGSLVAGPMLGLLGWLVRVGGVPRAALAAGVTAGLLSGEGWPELVKVGGTSGCYAAWGSG